MVAPPNADQANSDADAAGDICDDDNDNVADGSDNCPLIANPGQADFDLDNSADLCDGDDDADGVLDGDDLCLGTPMDVAYEDNGCGGLQLIDLTCGDTAEHPNHGSYVSCVAQTGTKAVADGLLNNKERAALVRAAARSR